MSYDIDDVAHYLPCVWHEEWWTNPPQKAPKTSLDPERWRMFEELDGERLKRACDPADIKGSIDPRRSNSAWSELVDVRAGWYGAELTEKERTTLFLAHSLFWSQKEIAFNQGVTVQAISLRIRGGLQKIAAWINGDEIEEEEAWMN